MSVLFWGLKDCPQSIPKNAFALPCCKLVRKPSSGHQKENPVARLYALSNVAPIGVPTAPFEFSLVGDMIKGKARSQSPRGTFTGPPQRR